MAKRRVVGGWLVAVALAGCGGTKTNAVEDHFGQTCMPGAFVSCGCSGSAGQTFTQTCTVTGTYGACTCPVSAAGAAGGFAGVGAGMTAGTLAGSGVQSYAGTTAGVSPTSGTGVAGMLGAGAGGVAGGTAGVSGGTAGAGGAAGKRGMTNKDPKLPTITATCPTLATGMVTVMGQQVQLWVGTKQADKKGAVFFYWHGTGSQSSEAALLGPALNEIQSEGGIVASFTTTTSLGTNTGNNVWYTGDFAMADIILACAVQQLNIDTHRIYTGGCSAGGLQSGAMVYGRSSYLAGAMPNSGGIVPIPGLTTFDDPSHVPSLITTHGGAADMVGVSFSQTSATEDNDIASKGGLVVDCDHGGKHCAAPADDIAGQWTFLKAHPFGVSPDPYAAGLPATGFPSYCKIIK